MIFNTLYKIIIFCGIFVTPKAFVSFWPRWHRRCCRRWSDWCSSSKPAARCSRPPPTYWAHTSSENTASRTLSPTTHWTPDSRDIRQRLNASNLNSRKKIKNGSNREVRRGSADAEQAGNSASDSRQNSLTLLDGPLVQFTGGIRNDPEQLSAVRRHDETTTLKRNELVWWEEHKRRAPIRSESTP